MKGTAPNRAASRGMCEAVTSMPRPQLAATMPMVNLSTPCRSNASGTSGIATPTCRPMAAQAANTGSSERQGFAALVLLGDTQMPLGAERGRLFDLMLDLALGFGGGLLLALPHVGVEAVARQKFSVAAALDDAAAVEHDDLVGMDDGREPVRDHNRGAAAAHLLQRALDLLLGAGVERAGRLVEQQDVRVLEDGAGDRHPLLLAARELQPALAHGRLVALRQRHDEVVDARQPGSLLDLVAAGAGPAIGDVVVDRIVEQ